MTDSPSLEELRQRLDQVSNELFSAAHTDDVYWQLQAIIRDNPDLHRPSEFLNWLHEAYRDSIIIRLRRLRDHTRNAVSLWRFLNDLEKHTKSLTRAWFLGNARRGYEWVAQESFDRIAGAGADRVSGTLIKRRSKELVDATAKLRDYANDFIAHTLDGPPPPSLTGTEVRQALVAVFRIFNWCWLLFTGGTFWTPVPLLPDPTRLCVFEVPWLPRDKPLPKYRHLDELIEEGGRLPPTPGST